MPVKRVYSAFTNALKVRGFTLENHVATSSDKKVVVEFMGETWVLKVDGKFVLDHPMKAGSMTDLERALKTYDTVLTPSPSLKGSVRKSKNRVEVRKANQAAGLGRTTEHQVLDPYKKGDSQVSAASKMSFLSGIRDLGFHSQEGGIRMDNFFLKFSESESVWQLCHYDRVLGEGVCSWESVSIIDNIIDSMTEC